MVERFFRDVRLGWKGLFASPGFTAIAVLTLGLGIGANAAIFALVDAVLLRTLPVQQPDRLLFVQYAGSRGGTAASSYPCFDGFRRQARSFSPAAFAPASLKVYLGGDAEKVRGQYVSGNFFPLLGVRTVVGRAVQPSDDEVIGTGGTDGPVAVLGHDYWRRRFGADPGVVGRVIRVGDTAVTIIGVTEPRFFGLAPGSTVDLTLPLALADPARLSDRSAWWLFTVGRVRPGGTEQQARAELDAIFQPYLDSAALPDDARREYFARVELMPAAHGLEGLRSRYSQALLVLMALVGVVMLIACANLANLLLARAESLRREFALRLALGATRGVLGRQMFAQALLLAGLGGLAGLLLGRWSASLLVQFLSSGRQPIVLDVPLDGRLLLFTFGLSAVAALAFSLAPAWRSARVDPWPVLKEGASTSSATRSQLAYRKALVVSQVAFSLLLLVAAGLFTRTLYGLESLPRGFRSDGVLTLRVEPDPHRTGPNRGYWREVLARAKAIPGVESASLSTLTPMDGRQHGALIEVPGFPVASPRDRAVQLNHVSPEYFATLGIPVLRGRPIREGDVQTSPRAALLNRSAARFYFGEGDPIGTRIRITHPPTEQPYEIVGIAEDSLQAGLREGPGRLLYVSTDQSLAPLDSLTVAVRTAGDPESVARTLRREIATLAPDTLLGEVVAMEAQVDQTLLRERLLLGLSGAFAALALLLACVGLYGVLSYEVLRRRHEMGIRMALGADRARMVRLVLGSAMSLVAAGLAFGLLASWAVTRVLGGLLYGIHPADPLTFAAVSLLLAAVALAAGYVPARRVLGIDPVRVLRST